MQFIFHEPSGYTFQDRDGHSGKAFKTSSPLTNHMIIECTKKLTVSITQQESEFNYYVIEGNGSFTINDNREAVSKGDLIVILPGNKYTFEGTLKMLLINTPHWNKNQEVVTSD